MAAVSRGIDRIEVTFDEPNLVANAGLLLVSTLAVRLGLERLINATVHLSGRVGGARPGGDVGGGRAVRPYPRTSSMSLVRSRRLGLPPLQLTRGVDTLHAAGATL